jgi:TRAP-type C4-dicarboxylate transport system permease small subunit
VLVAVGFCAGATIVLAFVLIVADVTIRTIGRQPPAFTSAVVEYILLYFTLFAAPYLVRQKGHVFVDALISRLPRRPRWVVEKLVYLVCVVTSLAFSVIGFKLGFEAIESGTIEERSIDVPSWVDYWAVGPIFLLVAIEFARYLIGVDSMYRSAQAKAPESL